MRELKRRLYRRGSSIEITIPKAILFGLDLKKKHTIIFSLQENRWHILFDSKPRKNEISRSLYKRGSSFETTLPLPLILHLNPKKHHDAQFKFDQTWFIEFKEENA